MPSIGYTSKGSQPRSAVINALQMVAVARAAIEAKKGHDIVLYDVRSVSGITDYYLVASGASGPQLKGMLNEIQGALKKEHVAPYRRSGDPECGWLVLDYVDLIIHVFLPQTRQYYAVDELWAQNPAAR